MQYTIRPMQLDDRDSVLAIFNHYIEHSFAAYREERVDDSFYDIFLSAASDYPSGVIRDEQGTPVGFSLLTPHKKIKEFSHVADLTIFLHPDYLGRGIGDTLLQKMEEEAVGLGITNILASISSLNPPSLRFHERHGFSECGRFRKVGKKCGQEFDVIWMQKML